MTIAEIYDEYFPWGWVYHVVFDPLSDDDVADDGAGEGQFVGPQRRNPSAACYDDCDVIDAMSDVTLDPIVGMVADSDSLVSL